MRDAADGGPGSGAPRLPWDTPETPKSKPWAGPAPPERILAIRLQALGDTVITLPYLAALRRRYPDTRLDLLTREEVAPIPRATGLFDEVVALGGGRSGRRQLIRALTRVPGLRRRRYDVVLDLQYNPVSRTVRTLLSPSAFSEFDRVSRRSAGSRTEAAIEAAGLGSAGDLRYDIRVSDGGGGRRLLNDHGVTPDERIVVLNPGGAFPDRQWPTEAWVGLARRLTQAGEGPTRFLVLGVPKSREAAARITSGIGAAGLDLVGHTSAVEAFAIVSEAALVVSEDSGLMHMAWVAGTPTLALFGASPVVWASPSGPATRVISACRYDDDRCMGGACMTGAPGCLAGLTPTEVAETAVQLLP